MEKTQTSDYLKCVDVEEEKEINEFIAKCMQETLEKIDWADGIYLYDVAFRIDPKTHDRKMIVWLVPTVKNRVINAYYYSNVWQKHEYVMHQVQDLDIIPRFVKLMTKEREIYCAEQIKEKEYKHADFTVLTLIQ